MARGVTNNPTYVLRACVECREEYTVETRFAGKSRFCSMTCKNRRTQREWQRRVYGWKPREPKENT
jgi:hypothetical protein